MWVPMPNTIGFNVSQVSTCTYARNGGEPIIAGLVFLESNGSIFWIGLEPYVGGSPIARNYSQFPVPYDTDRLWRNSAPPFDARFQNLRSLSDSHYVQDLSSRWWGFGANNFGQLCVPTSQTGAVATEAVELRLNGSTSIVEIYPVVYTDDIAAGRIFLATLVQASDDTLYGCVRHESICAAALSFSDF
jgi:hypothetical protein